MRSRRLSYISNYEKRIFCCRCLHPSNLPFHHHGRIFISYFLLSIEKYLYLTVDEGRVYTIKLGTMRQPVRHWAYPYQCTVLCDDPESVTYLNFRTHKQVVYESKYFNIYAYWEDIRNEDICVWKRLTDCEDAESQETWTEIKICLRAFGVILHRILK